MPEHGPDGDVIGKKVILDEPRAELVRRIFRMYLEGLSLDRIAYKLNDEKVEPARRGKYKNKGWNAGTIREILRNEAYVGVWTYGKRRWVKVPGTNNRRYRPAPPEQVIRREYPERRIIDPQTWREVQARIATVRAYYAGTKDKPKGMAQSGKKASHILNGLLRCATCGSRMIVYGGTTTRYLRCSNNKKKGICKNNLSLRDDIARARILGAVRARYSSPEALTKIRQAVAERLRQLSSEVNAELKERRERLGRTNERIAALVAFLSEGNNSQAVRDSLRDLESQKTAEATAIEELMSKASAPVRLPSPDELVAVPIDLEKAIDADPTRGREALARLFENGTITLEPQPGDYYIARSRFFPLGFAGGQGGAGSSSHGITPAQPRQACGPWPETAGVSCLVGSDGAARPSAGERDHGVRGSTASRSGSAQWRRRRSAMDEPADPRRRRRSDAGSRGRLAPARAGRRRRCSAAMP